MKTSTVYYFNTFQPTVGLPLPAHSPPTSLINQLASLGPQKTANLTVPAVASKSTMQNQSPPSESTGVQNIDTNFIYINASCKSLIT